jgi:hypothetical protein
MLAEDASGLPVSPRNDVMIPTADVVLLPSLVACCIALYAQAWLVKSSPAFSNDGFKGMDGSDFCVFALEGQTLVPFLTIIPLCRCRLFPF